MQTQIVNLIKKYKKAESKMSVLSKDVNCYSSDFIKERRNICKGFCDGLLCALKEFGMTKRDINKLEFDEN